MATIEQLKRWAWRSGIYPLLDLVVERAEPAASCGRRCPTPTAASPKASRWRRASCWPACCGTTCATAGRSASRTKQHPFPALQDAIDDVFDARIGDVSGRGKLAADMREIWMMQPRFEKRTGSTPVQPGRAAALPRRLRLHAPARRRRRGRRGAGRLVAGVQPGRRPGPRRPDRAGAREQQQKGARRVRVVKPQEKASPVDARPPARRWRRPRRGADRSRTTPAAEAATGTRRASAAVAAASRLAARAAKPRRRPAPVTEAGCCHGRRRNAQP